MLSRECVLSSLQSIETVKVDAFYK